MDHARATPQPGRRVVLRRRRLLGHAGRPHRLAAGPGLSAAGRPASRSAAFAGRLVLALPAAGRQQAVLLRAAAEQLAAVNNQNPSIEHGRGSKQWARARNTISSTTATGSS